jgi:two-component system cell cycle sensor histidine kinase PleC
MENFMQSSEASGAGATGFGTGDGSNSRGLRRRPTTAWLDFRATPATFAVAITAFLSATLFVAHDAVRTFSEAGREMTVALANATPNVSRTSAWRDAVTLETVSLGDKSAEVSASFVAPSTPEQRLEAASPAGAVAGRGAAAFALAGLFTALTMRRRRDADPMQRQNYATLASAIPMGVACWTGDGRMLVCNDHFSARLNLETEQCTYGEALNRLLAGGYMKVIRQDDGNRLIELHQEDGSCLMIDERPMQDGGFMTLISDVTERKRTDILLSTIREEQRLLARRYHEEKIKAEAASRAKTNFLAHLSHDIRTPLNHIIGFAELMQHQTYGALGDDRYVGYVESIKTSGEHLLNTFAAILDLAELENGQRVLRTDAISLDEVIDSVFRRFRGQVQRAGIALTVSAECGVVLRGDRLALMRMVSNIVENAIRFTPAGGKVSLATFTADDGVVVEISDTGIGMSEERLSSLSQPFALGDATFTRDGVGPGLGISISRAIAELSGGRMVIDSTPTIGTTVAISLPIDSSHLEIVAAE